jgi:glycosyltransferase involved in cell wall biosynthesis
MDRPAISFVLPAHDAAAVLGRSVPALVADSSLFHPIEVMIVENGSHDDTWAVARRLADDHGGSDVTVRVERSEQGFGHALRTGGSSATGRLIVLTGADVPFGLSDLEALMSRGRPHRPTVFVGSKRHVDSIVGERPPVRRVLTAGFAAIRRVVLRSRVADTQGSLLIEGRLAQALLAQTNENGFLITTELIEIAHRCGVDVVEVPVRLPRSDHPSTVKPLRDSVRMISGLRRLSRHAQRVADAGGLDEVLLDPPSTFMPETVTNPDTAG